MPPTICAGYQLVERPGETETTALFKGRHVLAQDRMRAVRLPQAESSRIKVVLRPERIKEAFGQRCQAAANVMRAIDSASPVERCGAERLGPIEAVHFDGAQPVDSEQKDYIVTEWVETGSLRDRLDRAPLSVAEAARIAEGVLDGLGFAHSRGLVHGNLKPNNILLAGDGQPLLVDFGGNALGPGMLLRIGSAPYMSPEQIAGRPEMDARTDTYTVALILYEMLTGRQPPRALGPAQMPSQLVPAAPAGLDEVILRGLQDELELRFQSAAEMRDALLLAIDGAPALFVSGGARPASVAPAPAAEEIAPAMAPEVPPLPAAVTPEPAAAIAAPAPPAAVPEPALPPPASVVIAAPQPEPQAPIVVEEPQLAVATPPPPRRAGERRINEVDGAEMVWVPGGELLMGSDRNIAEQPIHPVAVAGFWIYKHPVTQSRFLKYLAYVKNARGPEFAQRPSLFKLGDKYANRAAAGIRWTDAADYAKWARGSVPTEPQWEWAARGANGCAYPWGDDWDPTRVNTSEAGLHEPSDVDRFSRGESWCMAADLIGNVWEWCGSLLLPYPYDPLDGREDLKRPGVRALRGGAANSPAEQATATFRRGPSSETSFTGFRVALMEEGQSS
jgi:formylglycine-generating enzyme required for sulfatase activity